VRGDGKVVLFPDAFLHDPDFIIFELYDPSTTVAPEVRMIFMAIEWFIVEMAVLKINLPDQTAFDKKGDGSIEGCLGDPLFPVSQSQKELIHIEVVMSRKDLLNDRLSLGRLAKSLLLYVVSKCSNRLHTLAIIIEIQ
jgi:hypothetical protein